MRQLAKVDGCRPKICQGNLVKIRDPRSRRGRIAQVTKSSSEEDMKPAKYRQSMLKSRPTRSKRVVVGYVMEEDEEEELWVRGLVL
jgi:hypothetical protein